MPSSHMMFLCTTRCNLKCAHCLRGHSPSPLDIPLPLFERILREGKELGFTTVSLTGGEPCLHPRFDDLLDAAVSQGYTFSVASNGILWYFYAHAAEKYGKTFSSIKISIDGLKREHSLMRGIDNLEDLLSSITHLRKSGLEIIVALCLTKLNYECIEYYLEMCIKNSLSHIEISNTIMTEKNRHLLLNMGEMEKVRKALARFKEKHKIYPIERFLEMSPQNGSIIFCSELGDPSLTINAEGEAIFCCATLEHGAAVGHMEDMTITEAYNKLLEVGKKIVHQRIMDMKENRRFIGFNSCNYCNRVVSDMISRVGRNPS
ncbi:MAG: radical SAM protein [Candidatus Eremiobacteraeota bacterium]|nr:radical SAM protein [Candidatus Eremiobacteraeota bacterium]